MAGAPQARSNALRLIEELTHCPNVPLAWQDPSHRCSRVVGEQSSDPASFQVPEPWAGHLHEAPLLMISSNPSISEEEPYPTWTEPAEARTEFFDERFGDQPGQVRAGVHFPLRERRPDGSWHSTTAVPFWRECKKNVYVFGRDAVPGVDYAMTEVVHCKSRGEEGVPQALDTCVKMWLERVVALSPAAVVAVLGSTAVAAVSAHAGVELPLWRVTRARLGGRDRLILACRHPNYHGVRSWEKCLDETTVDTLRRALGVVPTVTDATDLGTPDEGEAAPHIMRVSVALPRAVDDLLQRSNRAYGHEVAWDVLPDGRVALRSQETGGIIAVADSTGVSLRLDRGDAERQHVQYGGLLSEVPGEPALADLRVEDGEVIRHGRDRLEMLLLRSVRRLPSPAARPDLTVDDLVEALTQRRRFLCGPEDMREYWTRRLEALSTLFDAGWIVEEPPSPPVWNARMLLDHLVVSLDQDSHPFVGVIEAPEEMMLPVMEAHTAAFRSLEEQRQDQGRRALHDVLLLVDPGLNGRTVLASDLAAQGIPPHPPRDEIDLIMDQWMW